ncbi:MAG: hypothetical protein ACTHNY_07515 [Solirubrobacterales bacterium]
MIALGLSAPASAGADGAAYPDLNGRISMVRGMPISLPPLNNTSEYNEVRIAIDGRTIQTDDFAPFGEYIPTRRFDHLGFELEVEHQLTETGYNFNDEVLASASYPLFIHPLPVIRRVHIYPLVVKKRTHLVGFQLRGIERRARVMAWGHGFRRRQGDPQIPLRRRKTGDSSRTYVVPGGLSWRRHSHPHVTFSISPPPSQTRFGFQPRGRLFTGVLRTQRNGDTSLKQTDGWKRCTYELSTQGRPPRRASCVYLF